MGTEDATYRLVKDHRGSVRLVVEGWRLFAERIMAVAHLLRLQK